MREILLSIDPTLWSEISAGIFLVGFTALVCWIYWPGQKIRYSRVERLPFDE